MIASPRDIPGLRLWLSADALTEAAGATLATWPDLSGLDHHATRDGGAGPYYRATLGAAGGPAVEFQNAGFLRLPVAVVAGLAEAEIHMSVKATAPGALTHFGSSGDRTHYPYSNGQVYENFGSTSRPGWTPTVALASWRRFSMVTAADEWTARLDGATQYTRAVNAVAWVPNAYTATPMLGASSTEALDEYHLDGMLGCVLLYGRRLTAAERADLDAWLVANPSGGTVPAPPPPPPDPAPEPAAPHWFVNRSRSDGLVSWAISSGRQDANARAETVQATVVLAADLTTCPTIGERFQLTVAEGAATITRFTGEVTDAQIDPKRGVYTITAAGRLGRARRRVVRVGGWPKEQDGPRVERILSAAAPRHIGTIDPGTSDIIKPTGTTTAGALLDVVADSTLGQVVEQLDGAIDWHDADHRRGAVPVLELGASEILNTLLWAQYVGDVVNEAAVSYGPDSASVTAVDPTSIETYEPFPVSVTTALADEIDAHSLGGLIVGRRSEPVWQLPQLVVDLWVHDPVSGDGVDAAKRAALLALKFADRITVTGIPAGSPYAGSVELYVEGMQESVQRVNGGLVWRLGLSVSDPRLSGVSVRYKDAPAALTYTGVDPTLTYLDLAQIENPAELGA